MNLDFDDDGALHVPAGLSAEESMSLARLADRAAPDRPGHRLLGDPDLSLLTAPDSTAGRLATRLSGKPARPVRAVLFDKSAANNWPLGWHQDRTIPVRDRANLPGFGPYTLKDGLLHVQPPAGIIARMVTLRLHLDPCDHANAPLRIARGSHRFGLVPVADVAVSVARCQVHHCLAASGDIWAYRTLILHASDAARIPRRRRVLQVDFASDDLPAPLVWSGI
jgi:hypothetical protein